MNLWHWLINELCALAADDLSPGEFTLEKREDGLLYVVQRVEQEN